MARRPVKPVTLTPKQRRFIDEYLKCFNKTKAARAIGYINPGAAGYRLMNDPRIQAEINKRQQVRAARSDLSAERVLEEIGRICLSDITDALDETGKMLPLKDLPAGVRAAISMLKFHENGHVKEVRLWPKGPALEMAGKHLRLFAELSEQKTSLEIQIRDMTPDARRAYVASIFEKARRFRVIEHEPTVDDSEEKSSGFAQQAG